MDIFPFSLLKKFTEDGKWLLAVNSYEVANSILNITDGNICFSFLTPGFLSDPESTEQLREILELRSQIYTELSVKGVEGRRLWTDKGNQKLSLIELDTFRNRIFEELKNANFIDP